VCCLTLPKREINKKVNLLTCNPIWEKLHEPRQMVRGTGGKNLHQMEMNMIAADPIHLADAPLTHRCFRWNIAILQELLREKRGHAG
jgi:hypothetical protein